MPRLATVLRREMTPLKEKFLVHPDIGLLLYLRRRPKIARIATKETANPAISGNSDCFILACSEGSRLVDFLRPGCSSMTSLELVCPSALQFGVGLVSWVLCLDSILIQTVVASEIEHRSKFSAKQRPGYMVAADDTYI